MKALTTEKFEELWERSPYEDPAAELREYRPRAERLKRYEVNLVAKSGRWLLVNRAG